jgi:hypothetical protein
LQGSKFALWLLVDAGVNIGERDDGSSTEKKFPTNEIHNDKTYYVYKYIKRRDQA